MARYFFDLVDGRSGEDTVGVELPNLAAVRREAMRLLPAIARDEFKGDGRDVQTLSLVVTDEGGQPVYTANLGYVGVWLRR